MNLPSENLHQLAGRLEEINLLNCSILIFRALIFLLRKSQESELFVDIFGGVVAMKKGGNK